MSRIELGIFTLIPLLIFALSHGVQSTELRMQQVEKPHLTGTERSGYGIKTRLAPMTEHQPRHMSQHSTRVVSQGDGDLRRKVKSYG